MAKRSEQVVQQFVVESAVEALDESVLLRLARLDVMPIDTRHLAPRQDRHAGELRAVVGNACLRLAADRYDCVKFSRDARAK